MNFDSLQVMVNDEAIPTNHSRASLLDYVFIFDRGTDLSTQENCVSLRGEGI